MPRLIWTLDAQADILRLKRFVERHNPDAAKRAVAAIRKSVSRLLVHSHMGRAVDGLPPNVRQWPVVFGGSGYVVIYQITPNAIVIASVRHGREAALVILDDDQNAAESD